MTTMPDRRDAPTSPPASSTATSSVPPWRVLLVGVLAGLASGLFGVGGGVVIVPGLVLLAGLDQRLSHGTSLTAIVPIAAAGAIGYGTAGQVDLLVAGLVVVGAMVGTPVGVALLARVPQRSLQLAFAGLLVLTAVRMLLETTPGTGREAAGLVEVAGYVGTGLTAGVLAGLMGVGGGVVIVPMLTIVFGFPMVLAKGTSLAVIVPSALVGTVRNARQATTDLRAGTMVGLGGVATAALASRVSLGLDPGVSAWLFAGLLVVVAVRMARRARA